VRTNEIYTCLRSVFSYSILFKIGEMKMLLQLDEDIWGKRGEGGGSLSRRGAKSPSLKWIYSTLHIDIFCKGSPCLHKDSRVFTLE
jgi:hypothetical protein